MPCPAMPLFFNAPSGVCRTKLGRGFTGLQGGRHLQQEDVSPVGWSRTRCGPGVREGTALCQEGCGGTMSLWVHQPHRNREQPYLSTGPSCP